MNESPAQKLHDVSGLMITQNADWSENFIGFERCNKYKICDENGNILTSGNFAYG